MQTINLKMPSKIVTVEIKKVGFGYKVLVHGVFMKGTFLTYSGAQQKLSEVHAYFGDDTVFLLKGAA